MSGGGFLATGWDCVLGCWLWGEGHTRCVCEGEPLQPVDQGDHDNHLVGDEVDEHYYRKV